MKFNLSIHNKLIAGFGILLALTATLAVVSQTQSAALEQTIKTTQGKEALLGRAQSALWELRYGFPQFLVLSDDVNRKKILDAEPKLYAVVEKNLTDYANAAGLSAEEVSGQQQLAKAFSKYRDARPRWFKLIADNQPEEAATWRAATTTPFGAAVVKGFTEQIDLTSRIDAERTQAQINAANRAQNVVLVLGIATMLFGIGAANYVYQSINKPLGRVHANCAEQLFERKLPDATDP